MATHIHISPPATNCFAPQTIDLRKGVDDTPVVQRVPSREECEQVFLSQLSTIERIASSVAREHRLRADEIDEFMSLVHLRIVSDDYAVLRRFQGHCALRTFLTVVIQRIFLDHRNAQWGRWRPSARSRRAGDTGVLLERLTVRDGLTFEDACAELERRQAVTLERDALERLYASFHRRTRHRSISDAGLTHVAAQWGAADGNVVAAERRRLIAAAIDALGRALQKLEPQDRLILHLRFTEGMPLVDIGRMLQVNSKHLYRRLARLMPILRRWIEQQGVHAQDVLPALGSTDVAA